MPEPSRRFPPPVRVKRYTLAERALRFVAMSGALVLIIVIGLLCVGCWPWSASCGPRCTSASGMTTTIERSRVCIARKFRAVPVAVWLARVLTVRSGVWRLCPGIR
jgi:hypothetical protein